MLRRVAASFLPALFLASCAPEPRPGRAPGAAASPRPALIEAAGAYVRSDIGEPVAGDPPWIAHLETVDLDRDGLEDLVACDARLNRVVWLRQLPGGGFRESVLAEDMRAPVNVEAADMDGDGDIDLVAACMSVVFPNNDLIGALIALENDGRGGFTRRVLLERVARATDVEAADLDGDGDLDLAVAQFGYDQGEVRVLHQTAPWEFRSTVLLRLSGAINVAVADFTGDRRPDVAVLMSQQWEEIHLFENLGDGGFRGRVIWGSTNEDFATSGMVAGDLNRDGRPDLVFTNGDGFGPNPEPGPRPWHGVQWLENRREGGFVLHRLGDLGGAYGPLVADLDADGDPDIVALSAFNDWSDPRSISMVRFLNDGSGSFSQEVLARVPTHLLTAAAVRLPGQEAAAIVTGAFHASPPFDRLSRISLWQPVPRR